MAFTGSPLVEQIADNLVRITGVSLAPGTTGTIALHGGTGDIVLPAGFQPKRYDGVSLQASLEVSCHATDVSGGGESVGRPFAIAKTGTAPSNFLATISPGNGSVVSEGATLNVNATWPGGGGRTFFVDNTDFLGGISYVGVTDQIGFAEVELRLVTPIPHANRIETFSVHMHPSSPIDPFIPIVIDLVGADNQVLLGFPIDAGLIPAPGSPNSVIGADYTLIRLPVAQPSLEIYVRFH